MAVLLAWIICPIVFGICFVSQTAFFLYKMLKCRQTDYSGESTITTISMSDCEVTCCMGWIWTTCVDKRTNRMTLKTFIGWYVFVLCLDIIITVAFYLIIHYQGIYV